MARWGRRITCAFGVIIVILVQCQEDDYLCCDNIHNEDTAFVNLVLVCVNNMTISSTTSLWMSTISLILPVFAY